MAKMVDRVMAAAGKPKNIRNIAICAHIDHGKTTFSDNLLSGAGMMSEELAGKARQLDFRQDEIDRGITIDAAAVSMVHTHKDNEYLINLIDTPGHVDFGGDVTRAMRAVDGCIVLSCAVEGIMPQTETVLKQALRERVRPILFINKVDRLIREQKLTPEAMQERFVKIIAGVNKFIRANAPEEFKNVQVSVQDGSVCFGSAFHNWGLSVPYMAEKNIKFKDVIEAYTTGDDAYKQLAKKSPIHEVVLNAVITHLPDPVTAAQYRIRKLWHGDYESDVAKSLLSADPKGPTMFVITKIEIDPQAGEISTGRLFSGTMSKGLQMRGIRGKTSERIQQVFIRNGAKREIVDNIPAGNVIGISGPKSFPGETLSTVDAEPFEELRHIFDPVITKAIEAENPSELPKLVEVLKMVVKEDPGLKIQINEETGEHLISGMGELHLEVIQNRIITEKGVKVKTSPPIVVYRESVTKKGVEAEGKSPNKHNKLYFIAEPVPAAITKLIQAGEIPEGRIKNKDNSIREKLVSAGMESKVAEKVKDIYNGNVFIDGTRGIVQIGEIMELVLDMFEDVMKKSPICNEPAINLMVTLTDAKLHEDAIHRGPAQMYPAIRDGLRETMMSAGPVLFEPIQTIMFDTPMRYTGEISKLISSKRGQLIDMVEQGESVQITGKMPVADMFGLSNDLRSATGGRGTSSLIDQNFEKLPNELQAKVIGQIRQRKGLQ